jgi:hypothetical protein
MVVVVVAVVVVVCAGRNEMRNIATLLNCLGSPSAAETALLLI